MIRHIVLTKFRAEVSRVEIDSLFAKLADLQNHIPGMHGFDGGVSVSPEGLEQGFRAGFSIDFNDVAARTLIWNIQSTRPWVGSWLRCLRAVSPG